jgi:hypothetical protein
MFENRVLANLSGSKWEEVIGRRRPLHYDDLHDVGSSPNIPRAIEPKRTNWVGHVTRVGEKRNDTIFGGETERKEITWKI